MKKWNQYTGPYIGWNSRWFQLIKLSSLIQMSVEILERRQSFLVYVTTRQQERKKNRTTHRWKCEVNANFDPSQSKGCEHRDVFRQHKLLKDVSKTLKRPLREVGRPWVCQNVWKKMSICVTEWRPDGKLANEKKYFYHYDSVYLNIQSEEWLSRNLSQTPFCSYNWIFVSSPSDRKFSYINGIIFLLMCKQTNVTSREKDDWFK